MAQVFSSPADARPGGPPPEPIHAPSSSLHVIPEVSLAVVVLVLVLLVCLLLLHRYRYRLRISCLTVWEAQLDGEGRSAGNQGSGGGAFLAGSARSGSSATGGGRAGGGTSAGRGANSRLRVGGGGGGSGGRAGRRDESSEWVHVLLDIHGFRDALGDDHSYRVGAAGLARGYSRGGRGHGGRRAPSGLDVATINSLGALTVFERSKVSVKGSLQHAESGAGKTAEVQAEKGCAREGRERTREVGEQGEEHEVVGRAADQGPVEGIGHGGGGEDGSGRESEVVVSCEEGECAVCLSEYVEGDVLRTLNKCHHHFHQICIDEWLSGSTSCPLLHSLHPASSDPSMPPAGAEPTALPHTLQQEQRNEQRGEVAERGRVAEQVQLVESLRGQGGEEGRRQIRRVEHDGAAARGPSGQEQQAEQSVAEARLQQAREEGLSPALSLPAARVLHVGPRMEAQQAPARSLLSRLWLAAAPATGAHGLSIPLGRGRSHHESEAHVSI
ncbi:unnamed protein product [Closterium sp. Naga37s-1]|nr:unnamed protein product [Closterium sp. Naga37s-1]